MERIGILAYGSLIKDPGKEIENVIAKRIPDVETPFKVEFARSSSTRGGAPALVPVKEGGAYVKAMILVLKKNVSITDTKNMLWRRETNKVCSRESYKPPAKPSPNSVCIKRIKQFQGIEIVLYTSIQPNIGKLTPQKLAKLAIDSVRKTKRNQNRDGISYLIDAKSNSITTPIMHEYEEEILHRTETKSLEEARGKLQSSYLKDK